jgi:CBS domain-containing protein
MTAKVSDVLQELISELNPPKPICVAPETPIKTAIETMQAQTIGCILVVKNDRVVGIFSERDLLIRIFGHDVDVEKPIDTVMTPEPECLSADLPIAYALNRMDMGGYRHIPIIDEEEAPRGIVSVKDIVGFVVEHAPKAVYNLPADPRTHGKRREGA